MLPIDEAIKCAREGVFPGHPRTSGIVQALLSEVGRLAARVAELEAELAGTPPTLEFTRIPPKEPGWYWWIPNNGTVAEVVEVAVSREFSGQLLILRAGVHSFGCAHGEHCGYWGSRLVAPAAVLAAVAAAKGEA